MKSHRASGPRGVGNLIAATANWADSHCADAEGQSFDPFRPGGICSASVVEPRTSANMADISTSAPPGCLCADLMHQVQSLRFIGEGLPPKTRMIMLPGLPNGV
jgi:hypothetical protein